MAVTTEALAALHRGIATLPKALRTPLGSRAAVAGGSALAGAGVGCAVAANGSKTKSGRHAYARDAVEGAVLGGGAGLIGAEVLRRSNAFKTAASLRTTAEPTPTRVDRASAAAPNGRAHGSNPAQQPGHAAARERADSESSFEEDLEEAADDAHEAHAFQNFAAHHEHAAFPGHEDGADRMSEHDAPAGSMSDFEDVHHDHISDFHDFGSDDFGSGDCDDSF